MEVCESKFTSNESDMGFHHTYAIPVVPRTGRNSFTIMERSSHVGWRNAKVGAPETIHNPLWHDRSDANTRREFAGFTVGALQSLQCR